MMKRSVQYLTVQRLYELLKDKLRLKLVTEAASLERKIRSAEIHRPGLAFSGFYDYFAYDRIQILGKTEISFLHKLSARSKRKNLDQFFSYKIPCIMVSKNQQVPEDFLKLAVKTGVPILKSPLQTSKLISQITVFIEDENAPTVTVHGTFVDVYGTGVLLLGKSGIGKSECALELVERGHRVVADDIVYIKLYGSDELLGSSSETIQHHMEVRGLGIINVKSIFGVGAIRNQKRVNLVVTLEKWSQKVEYERTGLGTDYYGILGVKLPHLILPVRPGRNLPVLVEIAALNERLKRMGDHSARELNRRLIESMTAGVGAVKGPPAGAAKSLLHRSAPPPPARPVGADVPTGRAGTAPDTPGRPGAAGSETSSSAAVLRSRDARSGRPTKAAGVRWVLPSQRMGAGASSAVKKLEGEPY